MHLLAIQGYGQSQSTFGHGGGALDDCRHYLLNEMRRTVDLLVYDSQQDADFRTSTTVVHVVKVVVRIVEAVEVHDLDDLGSKPAVDSLTCR